MLISCYCIAVKSTLMYMYSSHAIMKQYPAAFSQLCHCEKSWVTLWLQYCGLGMVFSNLVLPLKLLLLAPPSLSPLPSVGYCRREFEAGKVKIKGWDKNNLLETEMREKKWRLTTAILITKVYKRERVIHMQNAHPDHSLWLGTCATQGVKIKRNKNLLLSHWE